MAKILVTGGQGFIGSNLVPELRKRGHDVWVCDLGHLEGPNYIRCDVTKYRQLERIFEQHNFDYVYHLAAEYGRWNGEDYYENLWLTNVVGTKNLICIQEQKRFRMIFFSSAEVYGDYEGVMSEDVMDKVDLPPGNQSSVNVRLEIEKGGTFHWSEKHSNPSKSLTSSARLRSLSSRVVRLVKPAEESESPNKPTTAGAESTAAWVWNKPGG